MSAQCTDARVNLVTEKLFKKYDTLEKFAAADIRELEQEVGLALSKTASSVVSRTLLEYLKSTRQQKDAPQIK